MYFQSNDPRECCGCSACVHSCPVSAISFKRNAEGFDYPIIDNDSCINCGLCQKVCPVEHPLYKNSSDPKVYAAINKDISICRSSSSGGIFSILANWIIRHGGIVYGATIDSSLQVKHIGVETLEDLQLLRGSKYVQSDLGCVFSEIRQHLLNERWVYFVGTGCQVAGLRSFLNRSFATLLVSDLVCHGVPSQKLFDLHVSYLSNKYSGVISDYRFRDLERWGGCEVFSVVSSNGKVKLIKRPSYELSPYLYSFMHSLTFRYSCYGCKFATIPRQGDITLADFWGVKKAFPGIDATKGVSLVLINSTQGDRVFAEVANDCDLFPSNLHDASVENGNLVHHSSMPQLREHIYEKIDHAGYASIAKTIFRSPDYYRVLFVLVLKSLGVLKPIQSIRRWIIE